MTKLLFATVFSSFVLVSGAQTTIELKDLSRHVGDSVHVSGKVFGVRDVSNGKLTVINVGGAYPDQLLTVVVGEEAKKLLNGSLDDYNGKEISVSGKVELFKDKPQIVITKPSQLQNNTAQKQ
jgi:DNA/RNA endonuclease YhcR with UshA esterase domain